MLEPAAWAVLALPVALAVVAALAPPTGKDALTYHPRRPPGLSGRRRDRRAAREHPELFRVGEVAFGAVLFAFLPLLLATVYG